MAKHKQKIFIIFGLILTLLVVGLVACAVFDPIADLDNRGFNIEIVFEGNGGSFVGTNVDVLAVRLRQNQTIPRPGTIVTGDGARRIYRPPSISREGYFLNPDWHKAILDPITLQPVRTPVFAVDEDGYRITEYVFDEDGYRITDDQGNYVYRYVYATRQIPVLDEYNRQAFIHARLTDDYGNYVLDIDGNHIYRYTEEDAIDEDGEPYIRLVPVMIPHMRTEIVYDFAMESEPWDFRTPITDANYRMTLVAVWSPRFIFRFEFSATINIEGVPTVVPQYIEIPVDRDDGRLATIHTNMQGLRTRLNSDRDVALSYSLLNVFENQAASLDRDNRLNHTLADIVHPAFVDYDGTEGFRPPANAQRVHAIFTTWRQGSIAFVYTADDLRTARIDGAQTIYFERNIDFTGWARTHTNEPIPHELDFRHTIFEQGTVTATIFGNNHTISNIHITFVDELLVRNFALFRTFGGTMQDLEFYNTTIEVIFNTHPTFNPWAYRHVGFFAETIFANTVVRNVMFTGSSNLIIQEPLEPNQFNPRYVQINFSPPTGFLIASTSFLYDIGLSWAAMQSQIDITANINITAHERRSISTT